MEIEGEKKEVSAGDIVVILPEEKHRIFTNKSPSSFSPSQKISCG
jgi:quercetin dioxygenase-like cupin family protein